MIGILSKVKIIDNSGGLEGRCIKILNPKSTKSGKRLKAAQTGDIILISLTKSLPVTHITGPKKGNIYKALIVRTKKDYNKKLNQESGEKTIGNTKEVIKCNLLKYNKLHSKIFNKKLFKLDRVKDSFSDNSVVLVKFNENKNDYTPLGTRIKGPISKEIKNKKKYAKIVSILT